jgi:hypothetical protein
MNSPEFEEFLERDPVLSEKARAVLHRMEEDPRYGVEVLKRAGILDEDGQLAAPYRQHSK